MRRFFVGFALGAVCMLVVRTSLPFPHRSAPTERRRGLTADQDYDGHSTDASRSLRSGTRSIAPDSSDVIVATDAYLDDLAEILRQEAW